jgi:adenine-specific DNA-methyltransferase
MLEVLAVLDYILSTTEQYIAAMTKDERKKYGQFFTSKATALFMAGLYKPCWKGLNSISILDTGAGSGILSAALLERLTGSNLKEVYLTCYENDKKILPLLIKNLTYAKEHLPFTLTFKVMEDNYITSQASNFNTDLFHDENSEKYDLVIGNPPYMKVASTSIEAKSMPSICYGAPNLYFLFAAMALFNLAEQREMVYIIPRSWTSGAYFEHFRRYFLSVGKLEHIHLFVSRDKVFEHENVLQETIIIKVVKSPLKPKTIKISCSNSNNDFENIHSVTLPYNIVVSGLNNYVYLITKHSDAALLEKMSKWTDTLPSIGLKMKTGLTVDFREWTYLKDAPSEQTVPMFFAQHIKNGQITFPVGKHGEYLLRGKQSLLQRNSNYLFVKRFTSKEEKRRLQCGIYLCKQFPGFDVISTQNKINFIDNKDHNLDEATVYGLYVLFNSTAYDTYYRILNGSTQVNSTEINTLPVPSLSLIKEMGLKLLESKDLSVSNCDRILEVPLNGEDRRSEKVS